MLRATVAKTTAASHSGTDPCGERGLIAVETISPHRSISSPKSIKMHRDVTVTISSVVKTDDSIEVGGDAARAIVVKCFNVNAISS